jgi:hypothetical protein
MDRGRFAPLQLAAVLEAAIETMAQGRVQIAQGTATRFVWFNEGTVYSITSSLDDERLGAWLVERRLVEPQAIRETLVRRRADQRLGAALVAAGLLSRTTLSEELEGLAMAMAGRMLGVPGEFVGQSGWRLPPDAHIVQATAIRLFLDAVRRATNPEQFDCFVVDGSEWVVVPTPARSPSDLALTAAEQYTLTLLQHPKSLDALRRATQQDYAEVIRSLASLTTAGLIVCRPRGAGSIPPTGGAGGDGRHRRSALSTRQAAPLVTRPSQPSGPNPKLRAFLDDLEQQADSPERRRAEALVLAADRALASGTDTQTPHRLLFQAVALAPEPAFLFKLARLELGEARWHSRALAHLRQALELDPALTEAWLALGEYWAARGRQDKQRRCAEKILSYDPNNSEAREIIETTEPS